MRLIWSRIYVVTEYVIYPKEGKSKQSPRPIPSSTPSPPSEAVIPSITSAPSRTETPEPSSSGINGTVKEGSSDMMKRATYKARQPRADGGVVCSLAVNEYCFKIGRVTVPPVSLTPRLSALPTLLVYGTHV